MMGYAEVRKPGFFHGSQFRNGEATALYATLETRNVPFVSDLAAKHPNMGSQSIGSGSTRTKYMVFC